MDLNYILTISLVLIIIIVWYLFKSGDRSHKNPFSSKSGRKLSGNIINKFTINLTDLARDQKLDPVIGRENEIKRVIQILSRRKKNNAIILGKAGIGKTAIVEGLAMAIVNHQVPSSLSDKEVLKIDMSSILAGTKYRGEFENRFKTLVDTIIVMNKKFIVFIDEIHTIVQAGGAEGAIDADDIIKPPLARGELQMIGTTTTKEFKEFIQPDVTLTRRFEALEVSEPDRAQTIKILQGIKKEYEDYHRVIISEQIIKKIVEFSNKIKNKTFPDKAIDIMDEVCAKVRLDNVNSDQIVKITNKDLIEVLEFFKENKV
jgi:ATP-dependent Clp protease ATP-binding subunit ClpC